MSDDSEMTLDLDLNYFAKYKNVNFFRDSLNISNIVFLESDLLIQKRESKERFWVCVNTFGKSNISFTKKELVYYLNCIEELIKEREKKRDFTEPEDMITITDPPFIDDE